MLLLLAITVPSPSGMHEASSLDKQLILWSSSEHQPKLALLEGTMGSLFGEQLSFYKLFICSTTPVNLPCTIYWESPCASAASSVVKLCHSDADCESKDSDLLVSNLLAIFSTTSRHAIPSFDSVFAVESGSTMAGDFSPCLQPLVSGCFLAPNVADKFPESPGLVTSATAPEVCMTPM